MTLTRKAQWLGVVTLAALSTSCSANRALLVVSTPPSATVYVNGAKIGDTPVTVILPFDESPRAFVQVTHPQRQSREAILTPQTFPVDGEQPFDLPIGN